MRSKNKKNTARKKKVKKTGKIKRSSSRKPGSGRKSGLKNRNSKRAKKPGGKAKKVSGKKKVDSRGTQLSRETEKPELKTEFKVKVTDMPLIAEKVVEQSPEVAEAPPEVSVNTPEKVESKAIPDSAGPGEISETKITPETIADFEDSDLSEDFEPGEEEGSEGGGGDDSGVERLVFFLGKEEYAIELIGIQEIIRYVENTPIPRSGENIMGIISLRGTVIPIYDLRSRLGLDLGDITRHTRIVVVKLEKGVLGLIVDRISGVVWIPDRAIEPAPSTSGGTAADHLKGVATLDDRLLILLDLEKAITFS